MEGGNRNIRTGNIFPVIGLNEKLTSPEKEIVVFHELGHYYLGHPNSFSLERLTFLLPKIEYEAKIFAALCLIPTPVLEEEKDDILNNFPADFRESRVIIYSHFKNLTKKRGRIRIESSWKTGCAELVPWSAISHQTEQY